MAIKKTTIFKQLIFNIIIPVVIALTTLALLNFYSIYDGIKIFNNTRKELIQEQVKSLLEYQDISLDIVEKNLNSHIKKVTKDIILEYKKNPEKLLQEDLAEIKNKWSMHKKNEDLYIINTETGIIENTSFAPDSGKNVYNFGIGFKKFLIEVKNSYRLFSERFTLEMSTGRVRKYAYISTPDKKYIIETGYYSSTADSILALTKRRIISLIQSSNIDKIDLYIGADKPFSILSGEVVPELSAVRAELMRIFSSEKDMSIVVKEKDGEFRYQYLYMKRANTTLYPAAVIQIKTSTKFEKQMYLKSILKFVIVFGLTLFLVIFIIYNKTRVITKPIKRLVDNVNKIRDLHLNDRAEILGNNEITRLSEHFNLMLEQLEEYYNDLEDKVKERTAQLQAKKEEIERQQIAIMDSIHYASRIQNAILPSTDYIKGLVPDSFILYKPKDVVSGDFYWFTKAKNYIFAAAVDCTGHGVPGAFMSIVGNNQLDYTINIAKNLQPSEILNQMNKRVADTVQHQKSQKGIKVKDGMDMVLCRFDFENLELQMAAANNPIYILRNKELIDIKPTRLAIGMYYDRPGKEFENHSLKLEKGDIVYLFSDGYADQFGGPKNRKFLKKNLRNLLIEISDKPMDEQRNLLDQTFIGWKQDYHQVDDIMVLGIKV